MKIINLNESSNNGTYIGFTYSSMTVDEDYATVVNRLVQARDIKAKSKDQNGLLFIELHKDGEPVLIAVDKIEEVTRGTEGK